MKKDLIIEGIYFKESGKYSHGITVSLSQECLDDYSFIKVLKQKMKDNRTGYFFSNDEQLPYPVMISFATKCYE